MGLYRQYFANSDAYSSLNKLALDAHTGEDPQGGEKLRELMPPTFPIWTLLGS